MHLNGRLIGGVQILAYSRPCSWRTHGRTNGRKDGRTSGRKDGRTSGQTDGRTDGRTEGRTDGRTNERTNERTNGGEGRTEWKDERADGRTVGRTDERREGRTVGRRGRTEGKDGRMDGAEGRTDGRMDGRTDGGEERTDEWTDGRTDRQTDGGWTDGRTDGRGRYISRKSDQPSSALRSAVCEGAIGRKVLSPPCDASRPTLPSFSPGFSDTAGNSCLSISSGELATRVSTNTLVTLNWASFAFAHERTPAAHYGLTKLNYGMSDTFN